MKTKGKSGVMDMTKGNMAMLILSFALPLMLGNVFQQFYTVADTAIVGKILGVDALAALGTVESINWLVLGTIQGITQGFGILVSQQFGAKKEEALQETIFHASFLAVVAAILFTVGILIGLPGLVGILQVPVDIRPICLDYLYVLFGGIPLMMLYNFTAAMLRAFGDSKTPLTACVIAALFNIALDLYFILELGWGVKGAALATVIAQTLASAYCLWKLCRIEVLAEKRKAAKWRLHAGLCGKLIYLGLPMAFQNLVIAIGGMIVQTVVNSFGVAFIAGYTATCKLYGILEVAATSYGFAMVTYTGQNLGAGKTDRIKEGTRIGVLIGVLTSFVITGLMFLLGRNILGLFISADAAQGSQAAVVAWRFLRIMSSFLWVLYILHIVRSVIQGMGNTVIPLVSGIFEFIMRTGATLILPVLFGENGILFAEVLAWMGADLVLIPGYLYMRKKLLSGRSDQGDVQSAV